MTVESTAKQVADDIRRTRFMPQTRAERIALISDAVARVIPFKNSAWLYVDRYGGLQDCITYPHCYPDLQKLYASELHASPDRFGLFPWPTLMRLTGVFDLGEMSMGLFYRSELYQRCMVPVGLRASLCMPLIDANGTVYGFMIIGRAPGLEFARNERRLLLSLQDAIGRACAGDLAVHVDQIDYVTEEEGVLVIDRQGSMVHSDRPGRRLLWLATHPYLDEAISNSNNEKLLLRQLAQIGLDEFKPGGHSVKGTPDVRTSHDRGQYDFRVHPFEPESGLFGVVVRRSTARLTRIARRLMGLRAGARQKEIAILLARGFSYPEIALELGVSVKSVGTQIRLLYKKLNVNSREALVDALGHAGELGHEMSFLGNGGTST